MRFLADGPHLPDEVLIARDEGRVLFFCGAGVSQARAELPGFLGLAKRVLESLRVLPDSPARKLVEQSERMERIEGVGSILAADRIFGLLEREFSLSDIERVVGSALRPRPGADLGAHRTILDLCRDPDGAARLVTTNFDLLFEATGAKLPRWTPRELPDLRRREPFDGIVHLHGVFDNTYTRAVGGNLVLSSAEFGRAYLAEGWATDFIRAAIERYVVVFIGYTADDPPVQYLLEALNRAAVPSPHGVYAFQTGGEGTAQALWKHKGVTAIPYAPSADHGALWDTLTAWVERARNPERWRKRLIRRALKGPETMAPHERGQIAHLASTAVGAKELAETRRCIPAEWLCVFDPNIRYNTPEPLSLFDRGAPIDPFELYGLDSDSVPPKLNKNNIYERRDVPRAAIDVLAPLPLDGAAADAAGLRGASAAAVPMPPPRLMSLAGWLTNVCREPAAIWWASGQTCLHPVLLRYLTFQLDGRHATLPPLTRTAWRYLMEAWRRNPHPRDIAATYAINERLSRDGWTPSARRELANVLRAFLAVERPYGAKPPDRKSGLRFDNLIRIRVEYPTEDIPVEIPDGELASMLPLFRRNLEEASELERELNPTALRSIPPIEPDPDLPGESAERNWRINASILKFAGLFKRLAERDAAAAKREFVTWRQDDEPVFARLRVWVAGIPGLLDHEEAGQILTHVSDRLFWSEREQRDLLLVLARRWAALSPDCRTFLERRLRRGPPRERYVDPAPHAKWRAYKLADRLTWLKAQGCTFGFDVDADLEALERAIPDLKADLGTKAVTSWEGRGGFVHTDTDFAGLADVPLVQLISTALAARDRKHGPLEGRDPYAGLCERRPVRVLAALKRIEEGTDEAKLGWTHFLHAAARHNDKPALATLIAHRLARAPNSVLVRVIEPAAWWLGTAAERIFKRSPTVVGALFDRLLDVISRTPDALPPKKPTGAERDWIGSGLNSPAGCLTLALLSDPALTGLAPAASLPIEWKARANRLRALPEEHGRFCLAQLARSLNFFYAIDPRWAETAILSAMESPGDDQDAALSGFSDGQIHSAQLFTRMKPLLLSLSSAETRIRHRYEGQLASLCIRGWHSKNDAGERLLSDEELREVLVNCTTTMRTRILWHVGRFEIQEKLVLLREVWPLQLAARSPAMTGRLCMMAFEDAAHFPEMVQAILPLVSPGEVAGIYFSTARGIFERYPAQVLELLSVVLPMDASKWPYGVDSELLTLWERSPALRKDARLVALRRRMEEAR